MQRRVPPRIALNCFAGVSVAVSSSRFYAHLGAIALALPAVIVGTIGVLVHSCIVIAAGSSLLGHTSPSCWLNGWMSERYADVRNLVTKVCDGDTGSVRRVCDFGVNGFCGPLTPHGSLV